MIEFLQTKWWLGYALCCYMVLNWALYLGQEGDFESREWYVAPFVALLVALTYAWLLLLQWMVDGLRAIDSYFNVRFFWCYLFNRKALLRDREELDYKVQLGKHRNSGRLSHRIYRYGLKLLLRLNNYEP